MKRAALLALLVFPLGCKVSGVPGSESGRLGAGDGGTVVDLGHGGGGDGGCGSGGVDLGWPVDGFYPLDGFFGDDGFYPIDGFPVDAFPWDAGHHHDGGGYTVDLAH